MSEKTPKAPDAPQNTPAASPPAVPQRGSTEIQPVPAPAKPKSKPMPVWKVLLHNDDVNDAAYVLETIITLTHLSQAEARERIVEVEAKGLALVLTTHKERAELYQQQFTSCKLTVTIEPG